MESIFFPIVKKDKLGEFQAQWHKWFVLSNRIQDEKKPGLLKSEFNTGKGEMVALCPKNYQIYCEIQGLNLRLKVCQNNNYLRQNQGSQKGNPVFVETGTARFS